MPREADRGRARQIDFERSFQLLACAFRFETDDAEVADALEFLTPHATQDYPVSTSYRYEIRLRDDRYEIAENGVDLDYERCPEFVMRSLYRRINRLAMDAVAGATIIHSGSGRHRGQRFLVVGARLSGKSTVMARLLFEGVEAQGDEMALLSDGMTTPFPRRFHVREASLAYLPELEAMLTTLPYLTGEQDRRLFAFDPAKAGFDWRIDTGPVGVVFFLEQNHGGQTRLVPCSKVNMVQHVMTQCLPPAGTGGRWIAQLSAAIDQARTYILYNGEPRRTAREIMRQL